MAVCMYKEHERQDRADAHAAYRTDGLFQSLIAEAAKRGYRPATLSEIEGSVGLPGRSVELYCWKGGLWVRIG